MRICSLLPSATEILYALDLGDSVAGITYECDFPAEVRRKPVVVNTRLTHTTNPAEIDRQVSEFIARGESLYQLETQLLREIAPDLIITQDLCHVCAASPGDLTSVIAELPRAPRVLSLDPRTLGDVWNDILSVGRATGSSALAEEIVNSIRQRIDAVERAVACAESRPRALCLEWLDPPFIGGHWVPEMVARAGATDVMGRIGEPSHRITWENILAARPEVIVVMPCGYHLRETIQEFRSFRLPAGWELMPAVEAGQVFAVDGSSYFSRPGPRLADGVEILAHLFHPKRVPPPAANDALAHLM